MTNMSKVEKMLEFIRNNPTNVRFDVLRNLLLHYGFEESAPGGGSSHRTFSRDMYRITIPKQNPVNEAYVKDVIKIIDELEKEKKK